MSQGVKNTQVAECLQKTRNKTEGEEAHDGGGLDEPETSCGSLTLYKACEKVVGIFIQQDAGGGAKIENCGAV